MIGRAFICRNMIGLRVFISPRQFGFRMKPIMHTANLWHQIQCTYYSVEKINEVFTDISLQLYKQVQCFTVPSFLSSQLFDLAVVLQCVVHWGIRTFVHKAVNIQCTLGSPQSSVKIPCLHLALPGKENCLFLGSTSTLVHELADMGHRVNNTEPPFSPRQDTQWNQQT